MLFKYISFFLMTSASISDLLLIIMYGIASLCSLLFFHFICRRLVIIEEKFTLTVNNTTLYICYGFEYHNYCNHFGYHHQFNLGVHHLENFTLNNNKRVKQNFYFLFHRGGRIQFNSPA